MSFEKGKSRLLDVSLEVQNIPYLFHAAIWSQKKVVLQKRNGTVWLDQPRSSTNMLLPTLVNTLANTFYMYIYIYTYTYINIYMGK